MVSLASYALGSAAGAGAVVYNAFKSRGQFYPAMMYLSTSKINVVILANMALVTVCALWKLVKNIFLGPLREAEVERLNEQSWREVMEILFVITIFRDEFSVSFLAMVTVLLLIKAFHWLVQKRIEYMETTPTVSRLSHVRIIGFMGFLLLLDSLFLWSNLSYLLATRRPSVELFFSFEYMILASTTVSTFLKYVFYLSDMLMEGQWESKALFTFYLELVRDLLHLSLYLFFFLVIFINKGLPLHLVRELYDTFRNFKSRVADFIRYRKITSNMNDRFPDATAQELRESDATCIICREEMVSAKRLPCGHLFHVHCLRSWLERQQTCPICRQSVIASESTSGTDRGVQADRVSGTEGGMQSGAQSSSGSAAPAGQNLEANNPLSQYEARIRAAAAAAAQYGSSFVCTPGQSSTFSWCPGYVYVPRQSSIEVGTSGDGHESGIRSACMNSPVQMEGLSNLQIQAQMQVMQSNVGAQGTSLLYPQWSMDPYAQILLNRFGGHFIAAESLQDNNLPITSASPSFNQGILDRQQNEWRKEIKLLWQEMRSISQLHQSHTLSAPASNSIANNQGQTSIVNGNDAPSSSTNVPRNSTDTKFANKPSSSASEIEEI